MPIDIKICGLKTEEAVDTCLRAGADFLGFIFFPKSPRNVSFEKASNLMSMAADPAKTVAVTVNADDSLLDEIVKVCNPDWLQLHGSETPGRIMELKERYRLPLIKAVSVREARDLANVQQIAEVSDRVLLDAKPPDGADLPGGNGITFDWHLLRDLPQSVDYFLSGGLDVSNIARALKVSGAGAVDISSGVESDPGVKDLAKIDEFITTIRNLEMAAGLSASGREIASAANFR